MFSTPNSANKRKQYTPNETKKKKIQSLSNGMTFYCFEKDGERKIVSTDQKCRELLIAGWVLDKCCRDISIALAWQEDFEATSIVDCDGHTMARVVSRNDDSSLNNRHQDSSSTTPSFDNDEGSNNYNSNEDDDENSLNESSSTDSMDVEVVKPQVQPLRLRIRPTKAARRYIRKYQGSTKLSIPKQSFLHLVKEVIQDLPSIKEDTQFDSTAILALQEASELYTVNLLKDMKMSANFGNREKVKRTDLSLALRLRGGRL